MENKQGDLYIEFPYRGAIELQYKFICLIETISHYFHVLLNWYKN